MGAQAAMKAEDLFIIYEDMKESAQQLKKELKKWNTDVVICSDLQRLQTVAARETSRAMFAIDIDMGAGRRSEGLEAIRTVKSIAENGKREFFVAVLTSHSGRVEEAMSAGADVFLPKKTCTTDALELLARYKSFQLENIRSESKRVEDELATREYGHLLEQLNHLQESASTVDLSIALTTTRQALSWPFLLENERLILCALEGALQRGEKEGDVSFIPINSCVDGAQLLCRNRARDRDSVVRWLKAAHTRKVDLAFRWLTIDPFGDDDE